MKKYELTSESKNVTGVTLYRIKALRDSSIVKAGDLGGWVEKESNLSHEGDSWVYDEARVFGNSFVYENARVSGDVRVFGNARVSGNSWVHENSRVSGNAWVHENAQVSGNAYVYGDARVSGNSCVSGNTHVHENAQVSGNAYVYGNARVYENAVIGENIHVEFSSVTKDLTLRENILMNITVQTNLRSYGNEIYCYKHVREDLTSLFDSKFQYTVGDYAVVENFDDSNASCSSGLHVSHASFWEKMSGEKIIFCKVHLDDIITVQEGKIRCKKLFVIGECDGEVF